MKQAFALEPEIEVPAIGIRQLDTVLPDAGKDDSAGQGSPARGIIVAIPLGMLCWAGIFAMLR